MESQPINSNSFGIGIGNVIVVVNAGNNMNNQFNIPVPASTFHYPPATERKLFHLASLQHQTAAEQSGERVDVESAVECSLQ